MSIELKKIVRAEARKLVSETLFQEFRERILLSIVDN